MPAKAGIHFTALDPVDFSECGKLQNQPVSLPGKPADTDPGSRVGVTTLVWVNYQTNFQLAGTAVGQSPLIAKGIVILSFFKKGSRHTMSRKPRFIIPGVLVHVVQRGRSREAVFHQEPDYQAYPDYLKDGAERYQCSIHAYVLMTNHIHILATPKDGQGITHQRKSNSCYYSATTPRIPA